MNCSYTYFVQNKITNQFYYGSRYKNVRLERSACDDFWIHYFTSSKEIKQLISKYGKDSFEFKILLESKDYDDCYKHEQNLISLYISNPLCLNRYYRNTEGSSKFSTACSIMTETTKNKISKKLMGKVVSKSTRAQIKETTTGRKKTTEHIQNAAAGRKGKKNKTPAWNKGLIGLPGHPNPMKGTSGIIKHTNKTKLKIGAVHIGRKHYKIVCPHCNKEGGCTSMKRWHFDNCRDK